MARAYSLDLRKRVIEAIRGGLSTREAARRFAVSFHQELAAGAPPSIALSHTRKTLRADGATTADWAAFRIVGRD